MNLNQVTVPVLDVERSIAFYEKLGLGLIVRSLPDYARFECPEGDSTFSIHRVDGFDPANGIRVYFEVRDVDATVRQLLDKGIVFEEMPADKHWLWKEARLNDPDGNQIIIYQAGNNRKNPPCRIQSENRFGNIQK